MKHYLRILILLATSLGGALAVVGQSNPAPQSLPYTQDFGPASFATMPAGTAAWNGLSGATVNTQALAESSAPTADATVTARATVTTTGGSYGYAPAANASYYVQSSSNATNGVNQLAVALNTTGCAGNVQVSYRLDTISPNPLTREIGVVFQFRVGNTGAWTTVAAAVSANSGAPGPLANPTVYLPAATLNQAEVQLRWASWRGAGAGNSTGFTIDDISATCAPTMAKVDSYAAYSLPSGNLVRWQSSAETQNLGFLVYREENGNRRQITPELIAGSALKFGAQNLSAGDAYSWLDKEGDRAAVYWIEDIDIKGQKTLHGPIRLEAADNKELEAARNSALMAALPAASSNGLRAGQVLPESLGAAAARQIAPETDAWRRQLSLAAGAAVKIGVRRHGWQRVTESRLTAAGLRAGAEARNLQLYAEGVETPMIVHATDGNSLGADGYIEFYGVGADLTDTDTRTYWLIEGPAAGLRYGPPARGVPGPRATRPEANASAKTAAKGKIIVTDGDGGSFPYTFESDDRSIYVPSALNGAAGNYFGAMFNGGEVTKALRVSHLSASAVAPARLEVTLQGVTPGEHGVIIGLNGQQLSRVALSGQESRKVSLTIANNRLTDGDNQLTLRTDGGPADVVALDAARLTYARAFAAEDDALVFNSTRAGNLQITGFSQPNARLFDLTDPDRAFELAARSFPEAGGYTLNVGGMAAGRTLVAVGDNSYLAPASVEANEPSNWTAAGRRADLLILAPRAFRSALEPLAAARAGQGLQTEIVNVEDVYDEWNAGAPGAEALRRFLEWTQANWQTAPRYALLAGDASYDPRNYLGYGETNLVPTVFLDALDFETASDEALADFNGDYVGEMSVGRFPAQNAGQLQLLVNRAVNFAPRGDDGVVFVADRPEGYNFEALNNAARAQLPENIAATAINRQYLTDVETQGRILQAINQGPAVVQYAGHGSTQVWTGAPLLGVNDLPHLTNQSSLSFFSLMTCLNGYFINPTGDSLAEGLLKTPNGGGIAVWASSGLTMARGQEQMNREFFRRLYQEGRAPRLGDAILGAKAATNDPLVRATWILFGDPTLRLR